MTPREWTDRLCQILDDRSCPLDDEDREAIQEVIEAAISDERHECIKIVQREKLVNEEFYWSVGSICHQIRSRGDK